MGSGRKEMIKIRGMRDKKKGKNKEWRTKKTLVKTSAFYRDLSGNRTRVYAVRGRRLDRLTNRPYLPNRGDKIRTCDLCVPNAALYQTEPRLDYGR